MSKNRDFVIRSHDRSVKYGIDSRQRTSKKMLDEKELDALIKSKQELVAVAEPFMNQLYTFVKDSQFLVILTDEDGCILNVIGNEDMLQKAHSTYLIPGAYMGEEYIGTNGMGTSIIEGYPLQITGNEHILELLQGWTCSGAPIRDPEGKITGCIDLTGNVELVNSHTLGMVAATATAIEKMLSLKRYSEIIEADNMYVEGIINSLPSAIFTADLQGRIRHFNEFSYGMLGYERDEFINIDCSRLIHGWPKIVERLSKKENILQEDVEVSLKANKNEVNLSAYPIFGSDGNTKEIVFVLKDVKKMRRLANKVTGSLAVYTFDKIIGESPTFLQTVAFAKKIADSKSTILLMGESGTGKEVFAQSIQNYSNRRDEPFVALNCGAIPKNLIESELFGYVGGAFTGAKSEGHPGKFEIADGGTLFLDEIGEMPYELQTSLLRVIEEGTVRRIGGNREIPVDVRIIAATNKNLKGEVEKGNFRKDLYYRLNVLPLRLPPLRERKEDIPLLIDYFMERKSRRLNKKKVNISASTMERLQNYDWPGNIRELENFVELIINTESIPGEISPETIVKSAASETKKILSLAEVEELHIRSALEEVSYNISRCAELLGISRNTLYRKLELYRIDVPK